MSQHKSHHEESSSLTATDKLKEETQEILDRGQSFFEKNEKLIYTVVGVIAVFVGVYFAYKYLYQQPRIEKANKEIYHAEHYFGMDSISLALNGNGADVAGFLQIIDKYGNTPAGNLANYYAGVSYYHLGEYDKAIKHLKDYKGNDLMLAPVAIGLMGDAYVELGKTEEAIAQFEKAAKLADNNAISPLYLLKAGIAYQSLGQNDKALIAFKTIKEQYYNSVQAAEIDKYIMSVDVVK